MFVLWIMLLSDQGLDKEMPQAQHGSAGSLRASVYPTQKTLAGASCDAYCGVELITKPQYLNENLVLFSC